MELEVRGFLVYDEESLMVLGLLRLRGFVHRDIRFKVSVHCGHSNPASIKLLENLDLHRHTSHIRLHQQNIRNTRNNTGGLPSLPKSRINRKPQTQPPPKPERNR
ncbi:MAG: hypothetical protein ACTSRF_14575 [Candidatus Freyarchaeota archaeon]